MDYIGLDCTEMGWMDPGTSAKSYAVLIIELEDSLFVSAFGV